jgi:hypothetical protein
LKSRLANDEFPALIVSAPAVELNLTVPLLALNSALFVNEPPIDKIPVGKVVSPPLSRFRFPRIVTLVFVKVRLSGNS